MQKNYSWPHYKMFDLFDLFSLMLFLFYFYFAMMKFNNYITYPFESLVTKELTSIDNKSNEITLDFFPTLKKSISLFRHAFGN